MVLCIVIGFIITKRGMFPPASAKGVSTISMVRSSTALALLANNPTNRTSVYLHWYSRPWSPHRVQLCALDFKEENIYRQRVAPRQRWSSRFNKLKRLLGRRNQAEVGAEGLEKISRTTAPLEASDIFQPCPPSSQADFDRPAPLLPVCSHLDRVYSFHQPASQSPSVYSRTLLQSLVSLLPGLLMPVSIAVIIGVPCAIVLPLKALFIETPGWTGTRMPNAPDGNAPLSFILVTATFLGGITVPANLILLGASFARLKVSRRGIATQLYQRLVPSSRDVGANCPSHLLL